MADGGDGTVEAFLASGRRRARCRVRGPLGEPVEATYARDGETAIIEMAPPRGWRCSAIVSTRRATTYGTGELLRDALDVGRAHALCSASAAARPPTAAPARWRRWARVSSIAPALNSRRTRAAALARSNACRR
jgi:hypothetical protein